MVPDQIAQIAREPGRQAVIDYRHVIQALLRKPGGFARYRYREELFPSSTYRRAYDRLVQDHGLGPGELEYLRLLKLTADLGSNAMEGLLSEFLSLDSPPVASRHVAQRALSAHLRRASGSDRGL